MKGDKYCRKRVYLELDGTKLYYIAKFNNCNNHCGKCSENKCPICDSEVFCEDIEIENIETKKKVNFDSSLLHMIKEHSLFEKTYEEKVDPNELIEVLNLKPNKSYKKQKRKRYVLIGCMGDIDYDDIKEKISWESFYIFD